MEVGVEISLSLPLSPQETQQKVTRHEGRRKERKTPLLFLTISFYLLAGPALLRRDPRDKMEPKSQSYLQPPKRGSRKGMTCFKQREKCG